MVKAYKIDFKPRQLNVNTVWKGHNSSAICTTIYYIPCKFVGIMLGIYGHKDDLKGKSYKENVETWEYLLI